MKRNEKSLQDYGIPLKELICTLWEFQEMREKKEQNA